MNDAEKLQQSAALISKHFDISQSEFEIQHVNYDEFLKNLTRLISFLLEKDFQRLLNGLYRIDVSEQKVNQVLHSTAPDHVAFEIAQLILERELQKVETRLMYKQGK